MFCLFGQVLRLRAGSAPPDRDTQGPAVKPGRDRGLVELGRFYILSRQLFKAMTSYHQTRATPQAVAPAKISGTLDPLALPALAGPRAGRGG